MKELLFIYKTNSSVYPDLIQHDNWVAYCESCPVPIRHMSEEELRESFSGIRAEAPSILIKNGDIAELVMTHELAGIDNVDDLIVLVRSRGY